MAIPSYLSNVLDKDTNTFGDWFERTKTLSSDMGTKVLTAETTSAGGTTTGNTSLVGIFSANTVAVGTSLRGGTVETPGPLSITSNTTVAAVSSVFNTTSHTINSNTFVIASNTVSSTSNTLSYTSNVITFNATGDITLAAANVNINAAFMNVSGNTIFSSDTVSFDSNDSIRLPRGTNAQRPGSPLTGMLRFNSDGSDFEGYDGSQWNTLGYEIPIQDETTNATRYVGFLESSSGIANTVFVSSTKLQFNPSTGSLNATDFNSLSDITHKEDIEPLAGASDLLRQIDTYSFNWKDNGIKSYGVLAQELEALMPELVNNSDGTKYVNYTPLIALLISAYKELLDKIEQ